MQDCKSQFSDVFIESFRERKFHVIFALGSESSREQKFQGTKVPVTRRATEHSKSNHYPTELPVTPIVDAN